LQVPLVPSPLPCAQFGHREAAQAVPDGPITDGFLNSSTLMSVRPPEDCAEEDGFCAAEETGFVPKLLTLLTTLKTEDALDELDDAGHFMPTHRMMHGLILTLQSSQ
jgi:hypothetical protein